MRIELGWFKAMAIHYNNSISKSHAQTTIAAIEAQGAQAVALQADLTTSGAVEKLFADAVAYYKTAAALSPFSKTGLTDIEDVVPFIRHLVSDGWWITDQTILINGGYTTK